MSAASVLAKRDTFHRGSYDWQALNNTAWRVWQFECGGNWTAPADPPEDFGPHYLQFMEAAE